MMFILYLAEISIDILSLIGGGPQGTLIGQIMYLVQTNNNADVVNPEDRYKFIDDLSILQIVSLAGLLTDYNFHNHVSSDIGIEHKYLPASSYDLQGHLNSISQWTQENLMKINGKKCDYMIFSRAKVDFATRLSMNHNTIDQ